MTARADVLFELADAVLCTDGPVRSLVGLSLAPGHGALYGGINLGRVGLARLRSLVAARRLPGAADDRIVLAVDVSPWLRPDPNTSPERSFCHTYGRGKGQLWCPSWSCQGLGHDSGCSRLSPVVRKADSLRFKRSIARPTVEVYRPC
ncbi:transposase [Actinokineospora sp. HUAS TT18]|uniref:transposase n=1 Tax=Actinokineospora sp. HUAS TT18 TaxID=3447451 RepID=UPI003F51DE5F